VSGKLTKAIIRQVFLLIFSYLYIKNSLIPILAKIPKTTMIIAQQNREINSKGHLLRSYGLYIREGVGALR
jgi:hypothetical protein